MSQRSRSTAAIAVAMGAMVTACDSTEPRGPGSIRISSSASIPEPTSGFFEYLIAVDNGTPRNISVYEPFTFIVNGLAHGAHKVTLSGLPSACTAGTEGNNRDVSLRGDDTASVAFAIQCVRTTGDLQVQVTTTGADPDPDGYLLTANGSPVILLPANATVTFQYVTPATYTLALTGVSANCTTPASQPATVTAGNMTNILFTVTCVQATVVRMVAPVSGTDLDPDGVLFKVGSGPATRVPAGTSYIRVPAGTQNWQVTDLQPNCTTGNALTGSYTAATGDTVTVDVTATCTTIGYGAAGSSTTDPAADTLGNGNNNVNRAHDVVRLSARYQTGWLILVLHTAQAVGAVGEVSAAGLQGWIDLDADESTATGESPVINSFGGSAQQGVDYALSLWSANAGALELLNINTSDTITHRVPIALEGDSIIIRIPLEKLADDGLLSATMVVGTSDRPTDIAPNTGVILARPATPLRAGIVAGAQSAQPRSAKAPASKRGTSWGPPTKSVQRQP